MLYKNVASQKWVVFAFTTSTGVALTGDAANITAKISIDGAAGSATNDTNPTELEDGFYVFDLTQAETNGDLILILPESSTSGVSVIGSPASCYTNVLGATAAANLEDMFDGTGYTNEFAPATQAGIAAIGASSGGAVNFEAVEDNTGGAIIDSVTFVGTVDSGTFASIQSNDGVPHQISDDTDDIDIVYGFNVTGNKIATSVNIVANVDGNADEMKVKVYDHVGADWETIATISGTGGTTYESKEAALFQKHTGTGAEIGKVYIRFDTDSTTPSLLQVDQCVVQAVNIGTSIGYADGAVWVDTNMSNTNTESFVDGVADNPVSTIAAALTIAAAIGLKRLHFAAGSSVTLAADMSNYELKGNSWTLAFGGQAITGAMISGATVSGTYVGSTAILEDCIINAITGPGITMRRCFFNEVTITNNGTAGWYLNDCRSRIAGTGRATFDFGAAVGDTGLSLRAYSGGIELQNMGQSGTDTASVEGFGTISFLMPTVSEEQLLSAEYGTLPIMDLDRL